MVGRGAGRVRRVRVVGARAGDVGRGDRRDGGADAVRVRRVLDRDRDVVERRGVARAAGVVVDREANAEAGVVDVGPCPGRSPQVGCAPVVHGAVGGAVRGAGGGLVGSDGGAGLEEGDGDVPQVARGARLAHDRDGDSPDDRTRRDRKPVAGHILVRAVRAVGDGGRRVDAVARVDVRLARPARRRGTRRLCAARGVRASDRDGAAGVDDRGCAGNGAAVDEAEVASGRDVRHERLVVDRESPGAASPGVLVLVEAAPGTAVRSGVDADDRDFLRELALCRRARAGLDTPGRGDRPDVVRVDRARIRDRPVLGRKLERGRRQERRRARIDSAGSDGPGAVELAVQPGQSVAQPGLGERVRVLLSRAAARGVLGRVRHHHGGYRRGREEGDDGEHEDERDPILATRIQR